MKVTVFEPNFISENHQKLDISPEMLAAILARYSRKGEGLEDILALLEKTPPEKFEETIWSFLDYGHASIGGLTGSIPVGVDKVSMLAPYLTFFLQPKQDGQETSTRYVEFRPEGLAHPQEFGIPLRFQQEWYQTMLEGFAINKTLTEKLDKLGQENLELVRIPEDATEKERNRMIRNFGFDRARYTLPLAGLTNFGIVMTAREWADTLKHLDSVDLFELQYLAKAIRDPMQRIIPRLMNHSYPRNRTLAWANHFLDRGVEYIEKHGVNTDQVTDEVVVEVTHPKRSQYIDPELSEKQLIDLAFEGKENRYDYARGYPERIKVDIEWNNMSIAEARDLNRQRPCKKDTLLAPTGTYMPDISIDELKKAKMHDRYRQFLDRRAKLMTDIINSENPRAYAGCLLLGDQTPFMMSTTGDHITYVIELRTGKGVHFRYDDHVRQVYDKIAEASPDLARHIQLGTGEPE